MVRQPTTLRRLDVADPADAAFGRGLVEEYVLATAEEMGDTLDSVEALLPLFPELDDFGTVYAPPRATFVVAEADAAPVGGVGVLPLADQVAEMKRLWVRPGARQVGVGRALADASLGAARDLGYVRMVLDVLPTRVGAIALYRSLGFIDCPAVHDYPFTMIALGRDLAG